MLLWVITEKIRERRFNLYDVVTQVKLKVVTKFGSNIPVIIIRCCQETSLCKRNPPKVFLWKLFWKKYHFTEITLWCGRSPVDLMHIFRSPFYSNTSGVPFLFIFVYLGKCCQRQSAVRKRECRNQFSQKMLQASMCISSINWHSANHAKVASWQVFRVNTESNILFQYYLRNFCYPLLQHFIQRVDNGIDNSLLNVCAHYLSHYRTRHNGKIYNRAVSRWSTKPINAEEEFFWWEKRW